MNYTFKSVAITSSNPVGEALNPTHTTGDFTISNRKGYEQPTVNGINEEVRWKFDFSKEIKDGDIDKKTEIISAVVNLTILTRHELVDTDQIVIENITPNKIIKKPFQSLENKPRQFTFVEFDLLNEGHTSEEIIKTLLNDGGILKVFYQGDSLMIRAELTLTTKQFAHQHIDTEIKVVAGKIVGGVGVDGGGGIIVNGEFIPIPPRNPFYQKLSQFAKDVKSKM